MRVRATPVTILLLSAYVIPVRSKSFQRLERRADLSEREASGNVKIPDTPEPFALRDDALLDPSEKARELSIPRVAAPDSQAGTKDAPVDGKDGRPHAGPFVETNAERDRKKAKDKGDDDLPSAGRKPGPKDTYDSFMPSSNDGVMDDPNRAEPKEGTRGTEGGVSEKNREDRLDSMSGKQVAKTPSEPKEAPPLPHSEQEKLSESQDKSGSKSSKQESKTPSTSDAKDEESDDEDTELGGLKVRGPEDRWIPLTQLETRGPARQAAQHPAPRARRQQQRRPPLGAADGLIGRRAGSGA